MYAARVFGLVIFKTSLSLLIVLDFLVEHTQFIHEAGLDGVALFLDVIHDFLHLFELVQGLVVEIVEGRTQLVAQHAVLGDFFLEFVVSMNDVLHLLVKVLLGVFEGRDEDLEFLVHFLVLGEELVEELLPKALFLGHLFIEKRRGFREVALYFLEVELSFKATSCSSFRGPNLYCSSPSPNTWSARGCWSSGSPKSINFLGTW